MRARRYNIIHRSRAAHPETRELLIGISSGPRKMAGTSGRLAVDLDNKVFSSYEQVKKDQQYRLAEGENEQFDEDFKFQMCDLSKFTGGARSEQLEFAHHLGTALEEIGFAILTEHGVETSLYEDTFRNIEKFFTETSAETKLQFRAVRHGSVNQGYFPIRETSNVHPDLVEGWVFCRRAFNLDPETSPVDVTKFWPDLSWEKRFRPVVQAHDKLILPIMQAILMHFGADEHAYDQRLTETNFGFRLNYYPPLTEDNDTRGAGRMLGHEDMDLFTLLPASPVEGLQVLNRKNMKWIRLNAPVGSIILNTGDYMQRITNNRLPSTTHRVSRPQDPTMWRVPRTSFPFAVYLWEQEVLEVLPQLKQAPHYPPISAIDFHVGAMAKYYGDDYRQTGSDS